MIVIQCNRNNSFESAGIKNWTEKHVALLDKGYGIKAFKFTFNNISATSWRLVLLVGETSIHGEMKIHLEPTQKAFIFSFSLL
jgi:hypothetical protein